MENNTKTVAEHPVPVDLAPGAGPDRQPDPTQVTKAAQAALWLSMMERSS